MQPISPSLPIRSHPTIIHHFHENFSIRNIAILVLKTLSYLSFAAGVVSFAMGLYIPAIGFAVDGLAGLILGRCFQIIENPSSNALPADKLNKIKRFLGKSYEHLGNETLALRVNDTPYLCKKLGRAMVIERTETQNPQERVLYISEDLSTIILNPEEPLYQCLMALTWAQIRALPELETFLTEFNNENAYNRTVHLAYYRNSNYVVRNFVLAVEKFATTGNLDAQFDVRSCNLQFGSSQPNTVRETFQCAIDSSLHGGIQETLRAIDESCAEREFDHNIGNYIKDILPIVDLVIT